MCTHSAFGNPLRVYTVVQTKSWQQGGGGRGGGGEGGRGGKEGGVQENPAAVLNMGRLWTHLYSFPEPHRSTKDTHVHAHNTTTHTCTFW